MRRLRKRSTSPLARITKCPHLQSSTTCVVDGKTDRAHFAEDEVYYEDDGEYPEDNTAYDDDGNPVDYDGEEGFWQEEEWDDVQSTYYGSTVEDMPANDEVFDTEEFDRVYAAYADNKRQLNQLRVSRGFFPVVQSLVVNNSHLLLPLSLWKSIAFKDWFKREVKG